MLALSKPLFKNLLTVASTGTTATSPVFTIPIADCYTFYMNVTTATAGTMNTVFQTSVDAGTTFVNIPWSFAQVATTTGCFVLNVKSGVGNNYDVTAATSTGAAFGAASAALNLQSIVDPNNMKLTYTIATGPYAFTLYVACFTRAGGTASE